MGDKKNLERELREQILKLGPWSLDIQVTPSIRTGIASQQLSGGDACRNHDTQALPRSPEEDFCGLIRRAFPGGLGGRTVLDCGCNCGAYLFWARQLGAGECLGFDVQERCISQALFLTRNRLPRYDDIQFRVLDIEDLGSLDNRRFDLTLFNGIFNHLPDPVTGLKIAAGFTREVIILELATRHGCPDGMLALHRANTTHRACANYGELGWLPTGPLAVSRILGWLGFVETRCAWQKPQEHGSGRGRLCIIASRNKDVLAAFDSCQSHDRDEAKAKRRFGR